MNTSRYRRSRSIRRDPLPHSLRFIRHRPWLFRVGALRLLRGLVVILGRLSKCYSFFLAFLSAVCGVGWLGAAENGVHSRASQRRCPKTTIRRWPQGKITRRLGRIRLCSAIPHRLRRIFVQACPEARLSPTYRSGPGYGGILTKEL